MYKLLRLLLLLLLLYSPTAATPTSTSDPPAASLLAWMAAAATNTQERRRLASVLAVGQTATGGRGLFATVAIPRGDRILSIPRDRLITAETAYDSSCPLAAPLSTLRPRLDARQTLALLLLHERSLGVRSRWRAFIDMLPNGRPRALCCSTAGAPTSPAERAVLCRVERRMFGEGAGVDGGCPTATRVDDLRRDLTRTFDRLERTLFRPHRGLFPADVYNRSAHAWAHSTVASRSFALPFADGGQGRTLRRGFGGGGRGGGGGDHGDASPNYASGSFLVLAPFADLLNHRFPPGCGKGGTGSVAGGGGGRGGGGGEGGGISIGIGMGVADSPPACAGNIWFNSTHMSTTPYWYNDTSRSFLVHADRDYSAGDEVTICYGRKVRRRRRRGGERFPALCVSIQLVAR